MWVAVAHPETLLEGLSHSLKRSDKNYRIREIRMRRMWRASRVRESKMVDAGQGKNAGHALKTESGDKADRAPLVLASTKPLAAGQLLFELFGLADAYSHDPETCGVSPDETVFLLDQGHIVVDQLTCNFSEAWQSVFRITQKGYGARFDYVLKQLSLADSNFRASTAAASEGASHLKPAQQRALKGPGDAPRSGR